MRAAGSAGRRGCSTRVARLPRSAQRQEEGRPPAKCAGERPGGNGGQQGTQPPPAMDGRPPSLLSRRAAKCMPAVNINAMETPVTAAGAGRERQSGLGQDARWRRRGRDGWGRGSAAGQRALQAGGLPIERGRSTCAAGDDAHGDRGNEHSQHHEAGTTHGQALHAPMTTDQRDDLARAWRSPVPRHRGGCLGHADAHGRVGACDPSPWPCAYPERPARRVGGPGARARPAPGLQQLQR